MYARELLEYYVAPMCRVTGMRISSEQTVREKSSDYCTRAATNNNWEWDKVVQGDLALWLPPEICQANDDCDRIAVLHSSDNTDQRRCTSLGSY